MYRTRPIEGELLKLKEEIHRYAVDYGLDFYDVIFEVCDYDTVNILAAQGGFPTRYPHWRFGMEYDQLSKGHTYGLQKIYEMVINTNPCYAYLLNANHLVDQKMVMAHVYGHADFFKNNLWYSHTNRSMMDVMANHGTKMRRYMERYGQDRVEGLVDTILSLENLLDINVLFEKGERKKKDKDKEDEEAKKDHFEDVSQALRTFMKSSLPPEEDSKDKKEKKDEKSRSSKEEKKDVPTRDVMKYLLEHAPLEEWEADVLGILREEAYYFLPQRLTKIMNEGWASYWHSKIMSEKALTAGEIIDFANHHAGVMEMSPEQINPYKIGIELFRDIEYRWDSGKFGKEYVECFEMMKKENWNKETGRGRQKIFEVRKTHNDITFIDEFFTEEFCQRQNLFTYHYNKRNGRFEIDTREFKAIKQKLLSSLTNFGQPIIEVVSGNFGNRGELHLQHLFNGVKLDMPYAADTMKNIYKIWKRPVNLTVQNDRENKKKEVLFVYDGKEFCSYSSGDHPNKVPKIEFRSK